MIYLLGDVLGCFDHILPALLADRLRLSADELPAWIRGHNIAGQIREVGAWNPNGHHALSDARALQRMRRWIDTLKAGAFSKWRPPG